jgi:hypothetical protein
LAKTVQQPLPPFLKPGTDLKYTVKILKVQTKAEFEKEMAADAQAIFARMSWLMSSAPAASLASDAVTFASDAVTLEAGEAAAAEAGGCNQM